jgi:hypothetical protein
MNAYQYKLYNNQFSPARHIATINAKSPADAVIKEGFDWVVESGGQITYSRKGKGYTNTTIYIFLPETLAANASPDFIFKRIF